MKKIIIYSIFFILLSNISFSQNVAINNTGNPPNSHAILDIDVSTNDMGILIPRLTSAERTAISLAAADEGLTVYDETTKTYWLWDGTIWINMDAYWKLTGNTGTVDGTNFLGTIDNVPLSFRINNQKAGRIASDNTFYGYLSGNSITSGNYNVFNGDNAGYNITTGSENTFIGHNVGYYMQTGSSNTAIGYNALYCYGTFGGVHSGGSGNVAIGKWAMFNPTSGDHNVAIGYSAFSLPNDGSDNVFIGSNSDRHDNDAINNAVAIGAHSIANADSATAIGYRAYADHDNTLILGQIDGINGANANTKVGIGTTNPDAQLQLADIYSAGGKNLLIGNDAYLTDIDMGNILGVYGNNDSTIGGIKLGSNGNYIFGSNGKIGIGTTNPTSILEVKGEIKTSNDVNGCLTLGRCDNSSEGGQINFTGAGTYPSFWEDLSGNEFRIFTNSSTTVKVHMFNIGSGSTNLQIDGQAFKPGGGAWAVASDIRSKENIVDYDKGLDELMQLRPVTFNYKAEFNWGDATYTGLIAQEVEEVVPTMVSINPTNGIDDFKNIDPNELTYILINSVKELKAQNEDLQNQIDELKAQLNN